jgi:hypothetical protein
MHENISGGRIASKYGNVDGNWKEMHWTPFARKKTTEIKL